MSYNNNRPFTTKDRDNDVWPENCAVFHRSGWWHGRCTSANLNGRYYGSKQENSSNAISWDHWQGNRNFMKRIDMKIKLI